MIESRWRPSLPDWVPYPRVAWFVTEGVAIGLVGLLVRELLSSVQIAVTLGNIVFFVGSATALLGSLAYLVLLALDW